MAETGKAGEMGFFSKICAWANAFPADRTPSMRRRSRRTRLQFDPQPFHLDDEAAKADFVRRIGGERLAHRCDHDEVTRRVRPAA